MCCVLLRSLKKSVAFVAFFRLSEPMAIQQVRDLPLVIKLLWQSDICQAMGRPDLVLTIFYGLGDKCTPMPRGGAMLGSPSPDPPITR